MPGICDHSRISNLYKEVAREWCVQDKGDPCIDNRASKSPNRPSLRVPDYLRPDIVIRADVIPYTGYGYYIEWLMRGLESEGYSVGLASDLKDERYLGVGSWVEQRRDSRYNRDWELVIGAPSHTILVGRRSVMATMWESTEILPESRDNLNSTELLIVPSEWGKSVFRDCGVKTPMEVVPLGVDLAVFYPKKSESYPSGIRFGTSGRRSHGGVRKGHQEIIEAFIQEFSPWEDARLSMKLWPDCIEQEPRLIVPEDRRIEIITDPMSRVELADWYRGNSVYVSGSYGEGFGLQPLESMACGFPVIATNFSGHTEYFDESSGWVLDHRMTRVGGTYESCGLMAKPTVASLRRRMREAFEDHGARYVKGKAAAERARNFSWWLMGRRYAEILIRYGYLKPKPPVGPYTALVNRVRECPHVIPRSCDCKNLKCAAGRGNADGEVTADQCLACVGGLP